MHISKFVVAITISVLLSGSSSIAAQELALLGPAVRSTAVVPQVTLHRVNVDFKNTPLSQAIEAVVRQSGMTLLYSEHLLPSRATVTYTAMRANAADVLRAMLKGSGVGLAPAEGDAFKLVKVSADQAREGVITGRILHAKTKQPVANVTIIVDGVIQRVTTDETGRFQLPTTAGDHVIQVRAVGFVRFVRTVTVGDQAPVSVEISLEPSASVLDEVIVTGTVVATERRAVSTPITIITADEITKRGITRIDQFFRGEVPGVATIDRGVLNYEGGLAGGDALGTMSKSQVYSRGVSNVGYGDNTNPLKTYVDGVEMTNAAYLGTIDPQSIERIEIITGPQAATIYGSGAMGGVMQIFTKRGSAQSAPDITLNAKYGILQSNLSDGRTPIHQHNVNVTGSNGPGFSYALAGSYGYTGQWQPDLFARTAGGSLGATHVNGPVTVGASLALTSAKNGTSNSVGPVAGPLARDLCEAGEWMGCSWNFYRSPRVSSTTTQTFSLNVDYRPLPVWQHHLTAGRNANEFALIPEAPRFNHPGDTLYAFSGSNGSRTTISYNTTYATAPNRPYTFTVTAGANTVSGQNRVSSGCTATKTASSWGGCNTSDIQGFPSAMVTSTQDESRGGFASIRVGVHDRLFMTAGLRGEHTPNYGSEHPIDWTPTTGATYTFDAGNLSVKLLASYGRASRAPNPEQRLEKVRVSAQLDPARWIDQFANPYLRPEIATGPQGGVEFYYGNHASLTLNHYRQKVRDLIMYVQVDSFEQIIRIAPGLEFPTMGYNSQYQNIGEILQQGWEATGSLTMWRITFRGTYSWMDSRVEKTTLAPPQPQPGDVFPGMPTHNANVIAIYAFGGTSVTLSANYGGASTQQSGGSRIANDLQRARLLHYLSRTVDPNFPLARPGYTKTNLTASHRISARVSGLLQIDNLGNSYEADLGPMIPTLGRQTLLGVSVRYGGGARP